MGPIAAKLKRGAMLFLVITVIRSLYFGSCTFLPHTDVTCEEEFELKINLLQTKRAALHNT